MELSQKEKDKINQWYLNLDSRIREEILDVIFPDDIIYDVDDNWNKLTWETRYRIYKENNP